MGDLRKEKTSMVASGVNTLQTTRVPIKTSARVATFINFSGFPSFFAPHFASYSQRSFSSRRNELPRAAEFSFSICRNNSITKTTGVRGFAPSESSFVRSLKNFEPSVRLSRFPRFRCARLVNYPTFPLNNTLPAGHSSICSNLVSRSKLQISAGISIIKIPKFN